MDRARVDLHLHSYFSDGDVSPKELARECKKAGLEIVALTDHECVDGLPEFFEAGMELGIKTITGAEISVSHDAAEQHLLAIGINPENVQFRSFLKRCSEDKLKQMQVMVEKLNDLKLAVGFTEVQNSAMGSITIGHIARIAFKNNRNKETLRRLGVYSFGDLRPLFMPGGMVFTERQFPPINEAVEAINGSGGIAVWAHPFWREQTPKFVSDMAKIFKVMGLRGLEVFYPLHSKETVEVLHQIAQELALFESAGSDFHSFRFKKHSKVFAWQDFGIKTSFDILSLLGES